MTVNQDEVKGVLLDCLFVMSLVDTIKLPATNAVIDETKNKIKSLISQMGE